MILSDFDEGLECLQCRQRIESSTFTTHNSSSTLFAMRLIKLFFIVSIYSSSLSRIDTFLCEIRDPTKSLVRNESNFPSSSTTRQLPTQKSSTQHAKLKVSVQPLIWDIIAWIRTNLIWIMSRHQSTANIETSCIEIHPHHGRSSTLFWLADPFDAPPILCGKAQQYHETKEGKRNETRVSLLSRLWILFVFGTVSKSVEYCDNLRRYWIFSVFYSQSSERNR